LGQAAMAITPDAGKVAIPPFAPQVSSNASALAPGLAHSPLSAFFGVGFTENGCGFLEKGGLCFLSSGRVKRTREFVVHPNYILVYRIVGKTVEVLRVKHAAQRWP